MNLLCIYIYSLFFRFFSHAGHYRVLYITHLFNIVIHHSLRESFALGTCLFPSLTRPAHYYLHVFLHVVVSWPLKALFSTYSLAILQSPVQDPPLLRSCSGSSACSELYYIRAPTGRWNEQRRRMPLPNEHCHCLPLATCQVLPSPHKDTCAHLGNLDNFPTSRSLT